jgi:hypothetical protein
LGTENRLNETPTGQAGGHSESGVYLATVILASELTAPPAVLNDPSLANALSHPPTQPPQIEPPNPNAVSSIYLIEPAQPQTELPLPSSLSEIMIPDLSGPASRAETEPSASRRLIDPDRATLPRSRTSQLNDPPADRVKTLLAVYSALTTVILVILYLRSVISLISGL